MGPSVRPTIPTGVCKYCIVCVGTLPSSTLVVLILYDDCIVLHCVLLYTVWPLTHCIAFSSLNAAVIVL